MKRPIKLGIVGFGKIARDEHVPAIARTAGLELAAVASRHGVAEGVPNYPSLSAMLAAQPDLDAIVMCQPPAVRFAAAKEALAAGKHVFLEKPPGVTLSEIGLLRDLAEKKGATLFASWHSRFAASVAPLKSWCAERKLSRVAIEWREDVRLWHPGQDWIWEAGGFGVMDPGINALSILTEVIAEPVRLISARLEIPRDKATPIGAELSLETQSGVPVSAVFDWRETGPQTWRILFESETGRFDFGQGQAAHPEGETALSYEYRALYARFLDLVGSGRSEVDEAPLRLVADAFLAGRIDIVQPFDQ